MQVDLWASVKFAATALPANITVRTVATVVKGSFDGPFANINTTLADSIEVALLIKTKETLAVSVGSKSVSTPA